MILDELLEMYREGAITGYQVMMDCLHLIDPDHPGTVLNRLPEEILEEMLDYAQRFDPSGTRSTAGLPPVEKQVKAVQRLIEERSKRPSGT